MWGIGIPARAIRFAVAATVAVACIAPIASAQVESGLDQLQLQDDDYIDVTYKASESLRVISQRHLSNPDLWPIILEVNGLSDITELSESQVLKIPANQVRISALALEASLDRIQKANEAGAQVFAPLLIRNAIRYREDAVMHDRNGAFSESISLSTQSINTAGAAREKSEQSRDVEAEARLSDRQGWVEGQKSDENSWSERNINAILNEQEKLRTLSESTAQVIFRDASRLRLNPNSQAVIQRMRADPLKRREEAKISLVEGNFYALLSAESKRNRLEVSLPDVDAKIDSGNFWVAQDEAGARFSNYDVKPVEIVTGDETLVLGQNEGAHMRAGSAASGKVRLLGRISLADPQDNSVVYGDSVSLSWQAAKKGSQYWLEIAHDPRFDRMADSRFGIPELKAEAVPLPPGTYFWRVAALDEFGLPGQMSTIRKFELRTDDSPPFLRIRTPASGEVMRDARMTVSGESEPYVKVLVDDRPAEVDLDGRFHIEIDAEPGKNAVLVTATDPAGNLTERSVEFTYLPDIKREITYDDAIPRDVEGRFLSPERQLTISGTANPESSLAVFGASGDLRSETYTDSGGRFLLNVGLRESGEQLKLRVTTASGYEHDETIEVAVMDRPPAIRISRPLPPVTSESRLELDIDAGANVDVRLNGETGETRDGLFHFSVELREGQNLLEFVARNAVGLVTVDKRTILFDSQMPEIVSTDISVERVGASELISMSIGARDLSGLAKTSRFTITAGARKHQGVLRFNRARDAYVGRTEIPGRSEGEELHIEVELADNAGNIRKFETSE